MELIEKLAASLRNGETSCVELADKYVQAVKKGNNLNAYVNTLFDSAFRQAEIADKMIKSGNNDPLCGIPLILKDNICTRGEKTTCCSKVLSDYVPIYDATVWNKLKSRGAVLLGKGNMDEFSMGNTSETSCYGATLNPYDLNRVAGGSSGGVAAAVSSDMAVYGLGSDTGGSIRQPASFCGVVGLKPTYGAVSRYGLIAYASSLDQIGPITQSVKDCAIVFDAINGKDEFDRTCAGSEKSCYNNLSRDVNGLKIGVIKEFFQGIDQQVERAVKNAISFYEKRGAKIIEFSVSALTTALPAYYVIACAEASSNLGRYDGIRYGFNIDDCTSAEDMIIKTRTQGFGKEVKKRIILGTYALSSGYYDEYYKKAKAISAYVKSEFNNIFSTCDYVIAPTVPNTAFPLNLTIKDPIKAYLGDVCTVPVNLAGLPAVSVPCGKDNCGLPIGMQIIGKRFDESGILSLAYAFEQNFDIKVDDGGVKL